MGESIPLSGRIVAVADAFDAMISARTYKAPRLRSDAIAEIVSNSGRQFDPEVVQAFLEVQQAEQELPEVVHFRPLGQRQFLFDAS